MSFDVFIQGFRAGQASDHGWAAMRAVLEPHVVERDGHVVRLRLDDGEADISWPAQDSADVEAPTSSFSDRRAEAVPARGPLACRWAERRIQGGVMSSFHQKYGIGEGDYFHVVGRGLE